MIAKFYMKSGNIIEVTHVEDVIINLGLNGEYTKWSVTWKKGKRPNSLLSISLPQLEAVVVEKDETDEE